MLIILEGPDLAGKSTLAANLVTYLSVKFPTIPTTLIHRGPPTSHPLDEYVVPLLSYRPNLEHIICDRWHLGELVYPKIKRRKSQMNDSVRRYIEAFLASRGAVIVHVDANEDQIFQRYADRGDRVQTIEEVYAAARSFREIMQTVPHVRHGMATDIVDAARFRERMAYDSGFSRCATYVGAPSPGTLYVGDTRGPSSDQHDPRFPAFGPYPNTCGEFLLDAMPHEYAWGMMNANDVDGEYLSYATQALDVVALGRRASKRLQTIGIQHTTVPHPQYVKRFHHDEVDEYRRLLSIRDNEEHMWKS